MTSQDADPAEAAAAEGELPEPMAQVLAAYERHLVSERDLTPHTVRAYVGDIRGMLEQAARLGHTDVGTLDVRTLRSWLATQQTLGKARTTMARRATAVRVFTAWAQRTGRIGTDPGALLGSPKAHRTLPPALRVDEARALLEAAATHADDGSPVGSRDVAILELLYATGIRVGELCGLDVDDLDHERRVVRVFGKGRKERTVPFGRPAERAVDAWLRTGRPALMAPGAGGALFRRSRAADRPARGPHPGARPPAGRARRSRPRPARPPAHRRDAPARGWRRPADRPRAAGTRLAGHYADLHARQHRPATAGLPPGASAGLRPVPRPPEPGSWPPATGPSAVGRPTGRRAAGSRPATASRPAGAAGPVPRRPA